MTLEDIINKTHIARRGSKSIKIIYRGRFFLNTSITVDPSTIKIFKENDCIIAGDKPKIIQRTNISIFTPV